MAQGGAFFAESRRTESGLSTGQLVNFGNDYSRYCKFDITEEIARLEEYIEESLAKLEEFVSLFEMKESETQSWMEMALPTLLQNSTFLLRTFSQKLDTLVSFNEKLRVTIENLEGQVSQAEVNLGATSSFRSMMNYFRKPDVNEASSKLPPESVTIDVDDFFIKSSLGDADQ